MCPLSKVKLRVFPWLRDHNLKRMLDQGLCATVNSDDPAYFGGYIEENFCAAQEALGLTRYEKRLNRNGVRASFLSPEDKARLLTELEVYLSSGGSEESPFSTSLDG